MSGSVGVSIARSRGENRFYNPPAIRQRKLEQQRQQQEEQQRLKKDQEPSVAASKASSLSVESPKRTSEYDDCASSISSVSVRGVSSDASNLDRFLEHTTPLVSAQYFPKHQVEGIDKENFTHSDCLIEGDALSEKIEKISYETKLVASADGGSIIKSASNYHTVGDVEIKEEHVKEGKEKASGLFKLIEASHHANPDAYN